MKKLFTAASVCFLLLSCTAIKQLSKEEITQKTDCKSVDMNAKMIYYNLDIDGVQQKFLFDTGASMSVITDSLAIVNMGEKKFGALGTVTGADGKESDLTMMTAKVASELFDSNNKVFAYLPRPMTMCQKKEAFTGILGLDVFFKDDNILQLDFSNNKICTLSDAQKAEIIKSDYTEVKSECKSKQVFVFLTIDGKEYKFKMDTGFTGSLVIPFDETLDFTKYNSMTTVGVMYRTASSTTSGEEMFFENVPVEVNNTIVPTKVLVSKSIKSQNIGLALIKGFDWVIDYKNSKVYIKRNENAVDAKFNSRVFSYLVSEKEGRLVISTKQKQLTKYALGDQILAVDEIEITPENICKIQDLLNSTPDWSSMKIEIASSNNG